MSVLLPTVPSEPDMIVQLSGDYSMLGDTVGCRWWMRSWQAAQTTRVFRRFRAMRVAHSGFGCPDLLRWASVSLASSPRWSRSGVSTADHLLSVREGGDMLGTVVQPRRVFVSQLSCAQQTGGEPYS